MNLITVSSTAFQKYLHQVVYSGLKGEVEVIGTKATGRIQVKGLEAAGEGEVRSDFAHTVKLPSLESLRRFLATIPDQPVTIGFDNGWVWIKEAIL